MNSFGKVDLIKSAWGFLKTNLNIFIKLLVVYIVFYILQGVFVVIFKYSPIYPLVSFVFSIAGFVLEIGSINLVLKLVDGKSVQISDLYTYPNMAMKVLKTVLAGFVYGVAVVLGLILLVVPGIYLALRGMFFTYYIVDKDAGIMDSIKMSFALTKGAVINLFLFDLLIIGLNILGALLFGIGLLVTIPVSFIATVSLYRKFAK